MAYDVIITDGLQQDVDAAIGWYEEQQPGLGIKFYFHLLKKLEKLKANPEYYFSIHNEYRRIIIDPFPYSIYKIVNSTVLALAVFHHSRNPAELLKRIKE
jgi:plasmid stabilization system protein ParE